MVNATVLRRCVLLVFSVVFTVYSFNVSAQCPKPADQEGASGATPACGTFNNSQQGPGTFSTYNIVNGATYEFQTCGTTSWDTYLTAYNGNTSVQFNDDACGVQSRITYTSNFTGTLSVAVTEWLSAGNFCNGFRGAGAANSAILQYRQVDNLDVSSTPTSACPGVPITLVGTPAGGTWSGTGVSGNTFNVASPGAYGVTYTLGQCSRGVTINVGTNSVAASSVGVTTNPICQGGNTVLSVVGGTLGSGTWQWYAGSCGGGVVGTGSSITVTPTSTTTYFVRAINGCATPTACAQATVTVNSASTQPTTINSSNGNSVCPGSSTTLSLGNGSLGVGSTWQWFTGSCNGTPAGSGPSITPTITAPTTFFVRAVGPCETDLNCAQFIINTLPASTDPTGISKSLDNFCPGANTTLSVVGGSLGPNADWTWYSGPSCCGIPIGTGSSIVVAPTSTTSYYVRAEGGCIGATATATTVVTVKTESVAPTQITASRTISCSFPSPANVQLDQIGGSLGTGAVWQLYTGSCGGTLVTSNSSGSFLVAPATTTTYFIRASGDCNNTACAQVTITVSSGITGVVVNSTQPSCNGGSNGSATATPSDGIAPYSYSWSNGQTTQTATGLTAGLFSVTVTDAGGCQNSGSVNISQPTLIVSTASSTNVTCDGGSNGTISFTASGGTGSLEFSIDGGTSYVPNPNFTGLPVGTYNLSVRDANLCVVNASPSSITLTSPSAVTLTINGTTDASCAGVNDGSISSSATGGTGGFQYSINGSPLQPSGNFINLSAGTYTVLAQDNSGCTTTQSVTINNNANFTVSISGVQDVSCFGDNDGEFTAVANGGTAPFSYTINGFTFQNNGLFQNLDGGTYNVLVRDARGCQNNTTATIVEPTQIAIVVDNVVNIGCNGTNAGAVNISVTGGTPGQGTQPVFTPLANNEYNGTGLNDPTFELLSGGLLTGRPFEDGSCCSFAGVNVPTDIFEFSVDATGTYDITSTYVGAMDGFLFVYTNPLNYASNPPQTFVDGNDDCTGFTNSCVTVNLNAGQTYYLITTLFEPQAGPYNWNTTFVGPGNVGTLLGGTGAYTYNWSNGATTEDVNGLAAGNYTVTVTDDNGCTVSASVTVTSAPPLFLTLASFEDVSCFNGNDGSIDISVNGGTAPYTFAWSDGSISEDLNNLTVGTYEVTVTDGNGCTIGGFVDIFQPSAPLSINATTSNPNCNAAGSIDITVNGGTSPYSFVWSNNSLLEDQNNVVAGNYSVTITDANGCTLTAAYNLTNVTGVNATAAVTNVDCFGDNTGAIDVTATGGSGSGSGIYSQTITLSVENGDLITDGGTGLFEFTGTPTGAIGGTLSISAFGDFGSNAEFYDIFDEDNNNLGIVGNGPFQDDCSSSPEVASIPLSALQLNTWAGDNSIFISSLSTSSVNDFCPTNSVTITLTYNYANTPTYTYDWSTSATSEDVSGLTAGNYTVTIEDNNGCSFVGNYTVTQPTEIALSATVVDANCSGSITGSINLSVSGGTGGYTYLWSTGSTNQDISGLLAGTYTVTVTDANGCEKVGNYAVSQTNGLAVTGQATNVSCNGLLDASIVTSVTNASFPISYAWSNSATTPNLFNIGPGTYNVSVTDAANCIAVATFTITQPNAININLVALNNANCSLSQLGDIDVNVTGGTGTLTFAWSNGATTEDISNLTGGTYLLLVTDANGCNALASYNVTDPTAPLGTAVATDVSCFGANDGSVTTSVSGGNPPYTYVWSNGPTTANISGVGAGLYSVTITDQSGCSYNLGVLIDEPSQLVLNFNTVDGTCQGGLGSSSAVVSGGTNPYTYLWSNNNTAATINNLVAGTYTVTVSDDNGCSLVGSTNVSQAGNLDITAVVVNAGCNGANTGSLTTSIVSGVAPYTYAWSNGATSANLNLVAAGTYTVTLTDGNGCIRVRTFTVGSNSGTPIVVSANNIVNADCANNILGSVDINITGGTAPYTYAWTNGATAQDLASVTAGTYAVVVTDNNGCTATNSFAVNNINGVNASAVATNVACNAGTNGAINVTPVGGSGSYIYNWSNGSTTQDLSGLNAGSYNVTITDAVSPSCTYQLGAVITQPSALTFSVAATDGDCSGGLGSIDLSVAGGTPNYTYSWSNSATSQDLTNLVANTYSVTITDNNGCSVVSSTNISQAGSLDVVATIQDVNCFGATNGKITTSIVNGVPSYTFAWSNGAATQNLINVAAGTYTLTLTDANGCIRVKSFVVNGPTQIAISAVNITNSDCANNILGSIDIAVNGGAGAYVYSWTNGATTQDINSLIAGTYVVVVTDANGCTNSGSFTVTDPSGLVVNGTASNISCFGANDGSVSVLAAGGTGPYTYLWSNGSTSQTINGLAAGSYAVTVTDNTNCQATNGFIISEPQEITLSTINSNVVCNGASTGSIDLVLSGGTAPFSFLWSNNATSEDLVNVAAGTYSVTVEDANGCTDGLTVTLSQPNPINISASSVNAACNGGSNGSILLTVSGGFAPYTYSWNNGATTQNLIGLAAGTYTVTVTDANFCSASQSFTISAPATLLVTTTGTDADCANGVLGSVDATVTGGSTPYVYLWNNFATTQDITGLNKGTYVLTVTDASNCSATGSFTVNDASNTIVANALVTDVSCPGSNDGEIDVTVTGGTPGYTYNWAPGSQTTQDLTGLLEGNYALTITDAVGCGFFLGSTVGAPDTIAVSAVVVDGTCGGGLGNIDLTVSGGTGGPYGFSWSNGLNTEDVASLSAGTYTVTVTDAGGCTTSKSYNISQAGSLDVAAAINNVGCNGGADGDIFLTVIGGNPPYTFAWNTGNTTSDIVNVATGTYTVSVTDINGCIKVQSFTVTQPPVLQIAAAFVTNVDCFGEATGAVDITVTGGFGTKTYLWSTFENTEDISAKAAGTYTVVVTDANNCTVGGVYTITEPTEIVITETITNVACNGGSTGSISLAVVGGAPNYTYLWSNGQTSASISGLVAAIYQVTVEDDNGCQKVASYTVTQPSAIVLTASTTNVLCNGAATGTIDLTVSGGVATYTYSWTNGTTSQDVNLLVAGTYTVTVTDANLCSASATYTITEPSAINVTSVITAVSCNGGANGAIDISVTGGVSPYQYVWSNGLALQDISGLAAGTYTVTVQDANNCTVISSFAVNQPTPVLVAGNVTNVSCNGGNDGSVTLNVSGGTPGYTYLWSNGNTTASLSGVLAGTYGVTVRDANQCTGTATFTITQPTAITIVFSKIDVNCNGGNTGSIDITVSGGTPGYTYSWSPGSQTTQDISGLTVGTYTVTVTDVNNCIVTQSVTITEPSALVANANITNVTCSGAGDGSIDLSISGGAQPYTVNWSNGINSEDLNFLDGGSYTVTVTDGNSCTLVATYSVSEPSALVVLVSKTDVSCFGGSDGEIDITVGGGTPPYSYLWSNGATTEDVNTLSAGTYLVTVTDDNGCVNIQSITINEPSQLLANNQVITNVTCFGGNDGSIELDITGGTPNYTYDWNNGATTEDIFNLAAGTYTLTVLDANFCGVQFTFNITEPSAILANETITNVLCNDDSSGSIVLNVTGGTGSYIYAWSNGSTSTELNGLGAGIYDLTVTDANNCTASFTFTITEPNAISTTLSPLSPTCSGNFDGRVDLTVTGGVAPYSFFWSTFEFTQNIDSLTGGRYVVIITDVNGCQHIDSTFVTVPLPLVVNGIPKGAGCGSDKNGEIGVSITGGSGVYDIIWSNGDTTENLTGLSAGQYCITVSDGNSCFTTACYVVTSLPLPIIDFVYNSACVGEQVQITNNTQLASGTLTYNWNFGPAGTSTSPNPAIVFTTEGTYDVTLIAESDRGCFDTLTKQVTIYALPIATITITGAIPGECVTDTAFLSVPLDTNNLYLWSTGETTNAIFVTTSDNYRVTVTTLNGCVALDAAEVFILNQGNVSISNDTSISLGYSVPLTATGGSIFTWTPTAGLDDPSSGNPIATPDSTTTYTVTIADFNGCSIQQQVTITVVEDFNIGIPNLFSPNGDGANDVWRIFNLENYPISVQIFSRWGNKVWENTNYQNDWNGTSQDGNELTDGTYFYIIEITGTDKVLKGDVNILR